MTILDQLQLTNWNFYVHLHHEEEPWDRGVNIGHGLQRLTQAHGAKLPVVTTKGNMRPVQPKIAASFSFLGLGFGSFMSNLHRMLFFLL